MLNSVVILSGLVLFVHEKEWRERGEMKVLEYLLLCSIVLIRRGQTQLQYGSLRVANHGYVGQEDMENLSLPLSCTTRVENCCSGSQHGTWVMPSGDNVTTSAGNSVYQLYRSNGEIDLYITSSEAMSGIYQCTIIGDSHGTFDSYYVGLYYAHEGEKLCMPCVCGC